MERDEKYLRRRWLGRKVIGVVLIGMMVGIPVQKLNTLAARGEGNIYNCKACKEEGFACDKHIGFNSEEYMDSKIERYGKSYIPTEHTEEESKEWMYGGEYNEECDYCKEEQSECYTCMYDRKSIDEKMYNISTDEEFISKLNNEDWYKGYADSEQGREMLIEEVKSKIHGDKASNK